MVNLRDWLKLFRVNKSPLTVLLVEVFFLLGAGPDLFLSWFNGGLVLWATLVAWLGAGHNTLMDTSQGFDKENSKKKHDPLVSGSLGQDNAHNLIHWVTILALMAGLLLIFASPGDRVMALSFLLLYAVCGHAYNDGLGKSTVFSFIPYTVSYASLCAASYFLYATAVTPVFLLALVYVVFMQTFQVGWEGYLKDINNEKERNLLRAMKVRVEKGKFKSGVWGRLFGYGLKIGIFIPLFLAGLINITLTAPGASTLILLGVIIVFTVLLVESRDYNYDHDLIFIVIEDFASLLLLPVILVEWMGGISVIAMIVYAIVWFVAFNWLLWLSPVKTKD